METTLWIAAGIILGWLSYSFLRFNAERGMVASMMIGAVGALVGAGVAPVFVSAASAADELSLPYAFAAGAAVGFLALSDLVHRRFGVSAQATRRSCARGPRRHADRIAHAAAHAVDPAGELPGPVDLRHRVDETAEAHHAVLRLHVDLHGAQLRIVVERARHKLGNDRVAEVRALFLKLVLRGCVGEGAEPGKQRA